MNHVKKLPVAFCRIRPDFSNIFLEQVGAFSSPEGKLCPGYQRRILCTYPHSKTGHRAEPGAWGPLVADLRSARIDLRPSGYCRQSTLRPYSRKPDTAWSAVNFCPKNLRCCNSGNCMKPFTSVSLMREISGRKYSLSGLLQKTDEKNLTESRKGAYYYTLDKKVKDQETDRIVKI